MRRREVLDTLRTLLVALGLGGIIWYIARNEMTGEEKVEAVVKVLTEGDCRVSAKGGDPPRVRVLLTGPMLPLERVRDEILRGSIFAQVRLTRAQCETGGEIAVPITESNFPPPSDRRVRLRVIQREVHLTVVPWARRRKPVRLNIPDLDPSRYRVRVVVPREVMVRGPKALLDRITEVRTEPLRLASLVEAGQRSFQSTVQIATVIDGQRIECDERGVYVDIALGEETVERTLTGLPVRILLKPNFPHRVRIEPEHETATVVVRGPRSVVLAPQFEQRVLVFIRIEDLKPSTTPYLLERHCWVPKGVELIRIEGPDKVVVDILPRRATPTTPGE